MFTDMTSQVIFHTDVYMIHSYRHGIPSDIYKSTHVYTMLNNTAGLSHVHIGPHMSISLTNKTNLDTILVRQLPFGSSVCLTCDLPNIARSPFPQNATSRGPMQTLVDKMPPCKYPARPAIGRDPLQSRSRYRSLQSISSRSLSRSHCHLLSPRR